MPRNSGGTTENIDYFFDVGVVGALQGRTTQYGEALETYIMHELVAWRDYSTGEPIACWRSASGYEVDFILGDHTAIEVKAKTTVSPRDLRSLNALAEGLMKRLLCVCLDTRARRVGNIEILPLSVSRDVPAQPHFAGLGVRLCRSTQFLHEVSKQQQFSKGMLVNCFWDGCKTLE